MSWTVAAASARFGTASACWTSLVPLSPSFSAAKTASFQRSFVSSSYRAADPSTASTSTAPPSTAPSSAVAKQGSPKSRNAKARRRSSSSPSLADMLRAARKGPEMMEVKASQSEEEEKLARKAADEKNRRIRHKQLVRDRREAKRLKALENVSGHQPADVVSATGSNAEAVSPNGGDGKNKKTKTKKKKKPKQPKYDEPLPAVYDIPKVEEEAFLEHDLGVEPAAEMMTRFIEKRLAEAYCDASREATDRVRCFLEESLANFRMLRRTGAKRRLREDFLRKLKADRFDVPALHRPRNEPPAKPDEFPAAVTATEGIGLQMDSGNKTVGTERTLSSLSGERVADTGNPSDPTFQDRDLSDKSTFAAMRLLVENAIQKYRTSTSEAAAELAEKRLRALLSESLRTYRSLRENRHKRKHRSQFLRRLQTSQAALDAEVPDGFCEPAMLDDRDPFDIALADYKARVAEIEFNQFLAEEDGNSEATSTDGSLAKASGSRSLSLVRREEVELSSTSVEIGSLAPLEEIPVASLAYGLERILFNPGVHWLQDPRSKFYNYSEALQHIPDTKDFDFERLPMFMKPSSDPNLRKLLANSSQVFAGSTSSLTGALSQIYFALNGKKPLNTQSQSFVNAPRSFSPGARLPASLILNRTEEGKYVVDADKAMDVKAPDNPLSEKGHILEKMLTFPPEEFERFLKTSKNPLKPDESRDKKEAYHFATTSGLLMRSQLDCHDDRLPRRTFDIKTRGTVALRQDMLNYIANAGYQITSLTGGLQSFEREKYDLIRSAFLKYSMQVRIGNMDGIFLAYHSGKRIFGFEYLSLEDLDKYVSGSHEESEQAFKLCLAALETILRRATGDIPDKSLRISLEAMRGGLQVYAQPLEGDESAAPAAAVESDPAGTAASTGTELKQKGELDILIPEDHNTPLLLYDVRFISHLNGFEVPSWESVDFSTWRDPSSQPAETGSDVKESATDGEPDPVVTTPEVETSAGQEEDAIVGGEDAEALLAAESIVPVPVWSTTMDIELSRDVAVNRKKLAGLRKRQARFTTEVMLPEGLTKQERAKALRGFTPDQAAEAIVQAETGNHWAQGSFKASSGVTYTDRLYGLAKNLRQLAKEGRKELLKQEQRKERQAAAAAAKGKQPREQPAR